MTDKLRAITRQWFANVDLTPAPRVYIAGPMTGYPEWNYPAFMAKAAELRGDGWTVINPAELHPADPDVPWDWYLRRDLAELIKCTHIQLLPGWADSTGARLEHHVAKILGMTVTYPDERRTQ